VEVHLNLQKKAENRLALYKVLCKNQRDIRFIASIEVNYKE
jgi:hypothetical protein